MDDTFYENVEDKPSHTIYEGDNMIYIRNNINLHSLSISKENFQMNNIDIQTIKSLSDFVISHVYGILGIINLNNIPCLIYGSKYELIAFILDQCLYKLIDIVFLPLIFYDKNTRIEIEKQFNIFKEKIFKNNLYFSYPYNLTELYIYQDNKKMNEINSFLFNYEMITPFLLNKSIKNKHDFFTKFINGYFKCFENKKIKGQNLITYYIFRKDSVFNYYECELILRYGKDVFDYIYGMKIGSEKFEENFYKKFEKKSGIIFNCINNDKIKLLVDELLPYFNYIEYYEDDMYEHSIRKFIEEENKEIKKLSYHYSAKDPLTGKSSQKYKQEESVQDGLCIFILGDIETTYKFNKELNQIFVENYFSQYQKEKEFKNNTKEYLNIHKNEKFNDFFINLKLISDEFYYHVKYLENISFKNYIFKLNSVKKKIKKLKLFIGTYNVSAMSEENFNSQFNMNYFLFSDKISKNFSSNNLPDLYCISFEEIIELHAGNILISLNEDLIDLYKSTILTELCKLHSYDLLLNKNLVGILILIFIKSELLSEINNLCVIENKTGILGLGNKGNYIIKFSFNNKKFAFITGHLSSGDEKENFEKREKELITIFENLTKENPKMENLLYFIYGDLNFRIDLSKEKFNEIFKDKNNIINHNKKKDKNNKEKGISETQVKNNLDVLRKYDEMNIIKEKFKKYKLNEGEINFPPTYKYIKESQIYDGKRTPSWTDRILYKEDKDIKCMLYDTVDLYISDHKPLIGLFEINVN